jgi:hypothetical protein
VRLSRMAKRLREGSLAKSSSDTAECLWTQSDQDGIRDEGDIKLGMKSFSQRQ